MQTLIDKYTGDMNYINHEFEQNKNRYAKAEKQINEILDAFKKQVVKQPELYYEIPVSIEDVNIGINKLYEHHYLGDVCKFFEHYGFITKLVDKGAYEYDGANYVIEIRKI